MIGILGGGISGLTLQAQLKHPSEVLEKDSAVGGLSRTYWKDGFGYDIGGHILFSKHQHVNELVDRCLGENINHQRRANQILYKGKIVKYPFENDLAALPLEDRYECLIGYLTADYPAPTNLEEWAYYTFGKGISEKYLLPYNRKIWNVEPREIGLEWVERIPKPPLEDVVKSALGISTEGYLHQLNFRYPLHGGFETVVKALSAPDGTVHLSSPVTRIERDGAGWAVSTPSRTHSYSQIVIAFPIHEVIKVMDVPAEVRAAVQGLRFNAIRVGLLGIDNPRHLERSALYIPDPEVLPNRLCFMGYFSPHMVRPGTSSILCEVTTTPGDAVDSMSDDQFLARLIRDMEHLGLARAREVIVTDTRREHYAYPVYDLGFRAKTQVFRDWFASQGIHLLGRFAEFDYINSDECVHRALKLAEKLNAASA